MQLSKASNENSTISDYLPEIHTTAAIVRFDAACSLCKSLAEFMQKRVSPEKITFEPSNESNPEKLTVELENNDPPVKFIGQYAWQWLLENHPTLTELNWIAQKLGISETTSLSMMRGADLLRSFCFRCR